MWSPGVWLLSQCLKHLKFSPVLKFCLLPFLYIYPMIRQNYQDLKLNYCPAVWCPFFRKKGHYTPLVSWQILQNYVAVLTVHHKQDPAPTVQERHKLSAAIPRK